MSDAALLEAQGVGKRFGAVVAAADINIGVRAGERVSLIGSNGAGKTTFVNMITGYLKPDAGHIRFDGRDITALHPRTIVGLGVARSFQIPQLFGELSVLDNMLVASACQGTHMSYTKAARDAAAVARTEALLQRFALTEHRERRVSELPGGVRKLLDIAMALTAHPRLLLLDEPTSGVSADEKFATMDTVVRAIEAHQGRSPVTVVFVEHDMDIVRRYASRVAAFYSGRVIADGPPGRVLEDADVQRYVTGSAPAVAGEAA